MRIGNLEFGIQRPIRRSHWLRFFNLEYMCLNKCILLTISVIYITILEGGCKYADEDN